MGDLDQHNNNECTDTYFQNLLVKGVHKISLLQPFFRPQGQIRVYEGLEHALIKGRMKAI